MDKHLTVTISIAKMGALEQKVKSTSVEARRGITVSGDSAAFPNFEDDNLRTVRKDGMRRTAVIGSGISGMAAAYFLSRKQEVHLFEKETRLGGHTNTIVIENSRGRFCVDTGFIVHNDRTYPNLVRLFAELGVETQASDMSFAVACRKTGFEYSSRGLRGFFAQRQNLFRSRHYELFLEILRFNRKAPQLLLAPGTPELTLGQYLDEHHFSSNFTERYLYPMASAVWSASREAVRSFPALNLVRFFSNHGMLRIMNQPKWRVVRGGSHRYIAPLTAPYRDRIHLGANIAGVSRDEQGVTLRFADRPAMRFDDVVFACHGDQVLPLLESPDDAEREILGTFRTTRNEAWLHMDDRLLPVRREARASWNYSLEADGSPGASVTYHMNRLQSLDQPEDYCVTLNPVGEIDESRVLRKITYRHPLYDRAALKAQERWAEISGRNHTHYCGAYWLYGFHEDGLSSALRVAQTLGVNW
jgi:predicted NAD/FAD-binding protein